MLNKLTLSMLALALLLTPACKNKKNGETKEVSKQAASEPAKAEAEKPAAKPAAAEEKTEDQVDGKVVAIETSMGTFKIELDREKAPKSVNNFLRYVKDKHYDGTIFHRVIKGFMVQGGGFTPAFEKKTTREPIQNEADNGLKNDRGTVAMARTGMPHSATAQFFVNVVDNGFLNHRSKTQRGWGYTVFGKVSEGMDVVDKIRNVQTGPKGQFSKDAPQTDVVIKSAKILE